jgi:hypothetical protein
MLPLHWPAHETFETVAAASKAAGSRIRISEVMLQFTASVIVTE